MNEKEAGRPDLSLCLVSWNTWADLERAIGSIYRHAGDLHLEVVLVDNGSCDGSAARLRERFPEVWLIQNQHNLGFARANNQAMAAARGRYLLVLNPDTVVHPGALERLVRFMDEHPQVGVAGPRLINPDGSLQYSCRRFPRLITGIFRNTPIGRLLPSNRYTREYLMNDWDHHRTTPVDWVSGAAMCLRREMLEQVGPMDEQFYMYCEDVDLCLRASKHGWQVYYCPDAVITHAIGRSSDQAPARMVLEFHRSMMRFYRKHYLAGYPFFLRWLPPAGIWARAITVLGQQRLARIRGRLIKLCQNGASSPVAKHD